MKTDTTVKNGTHISIALLLVVAAAPAHAQSVDSAAENQGQLIFSDSQERGLARGQKHDWTLEAQAGEYIEVAIEQRGLRARAFVYDDTGVLHTGSRFRVEDHLGGVVVVRWISAMKSAWRIEVEMPLLDHEDAGRYMITWTVRRPGKPADRPLVRADSLTQLVMGSLALSTAESQLQQAIDLLEKSLGSESAEVSLRRWVLGYHYTLVGRYSEAEELLLSALTTAPAFFAAEVIMDSLRFLYGVSSRFEESEPYYPRILAHYAESDYPEDDPKLAHILADYGENFTDMGQYAKAEPLLKRVYEMQQRSGLVDPLCPCINYLGHLYAAQGRYAEAEPYYIRALDIRKTAFGPGHPQHWRIAENLVDLADLYVAMHRNADAEPLAREAVTIAEQVFGPVHGDVARGLSSLGRIQMDQGHHREADVLFKRALGIREEVYGTENVETAKSVLSVAQNRLLMSDTGEARRLLDRAIELLDASPWLPNEHVAAYAMRATLLHGAGDAGGALADLEEALTLAEEVRPQISGGEAERAGYFQHFADLFDTMVDWQVEDGNVEAAIEYSERGRSRTLLDQLNAGQIDLRSSIPAEERIPLEKKEAAARLRHTEFQQRITVARGRTDLPEAERLEIIHAFEDSLRRAAADYTQVYQEIKNASPLWKSALTSGGSPVTLRNLQRKLIGPGERMLLYKVGKEASYVFVIGSSGAPEALPLEVPVSAAAALGVDPGPLTEALLRRILGDENGGAAGVIAQLSTRGAKVSGRAGFSVPNRLHALWQTLVPETLWPQLLESETVTLIPDAMLHLLPFEALVTETGDGVRYWLDVGPVIRYAPSATVLEAITERPDARSIPVAGVPIMLSLSDPIYNPAEVMAAEEGAERSSAALLASSSASSAAANRNSYERAGGTLMRLPGTALETRAIATALSDRASTAMVQLEGLEATESNVRGAVDGKRYIHLATHGIVDATRGGLFASLAMTPPSGETAAMEDDGYLQLHEIYDLPLKEAELAVLSACESNVGPEVEGEGVFALSRGFLAAGARRVVASQWAVDDASTAELIGGFFASVLAEQPLAAKTDYAVALRDAKREVRNQDQWSDPYYWAPFILAGKQ